jgi:hypothetical protein
VRLGAVAETPLEWLALRAGWVPTPLVDTHLAFAFARTLMVAVRLGVFEALAAGERGVADVARSCGTSPSPPSGWSTPSWGWGTCGPAARPVASP